VGASSCRPVAEEAASPCGFGAPHSLQNGCPVAVYRSAVCRRAQLSISSSTGAGSVFCGVAASPGLVPAAAGVAGSVGSVPNLLSTPRFSSPSSPSFPLEVGYKV
jgi:hypothetical protein